jgi:hypothetical protein
MPIDQLIATFEQDGNQNHAKLPIARNLTFRHQIGRHECQTKR